MIPRPSIFNVRGIFDEGHYLIFVEGTEEIVAESITSKHVDFFQTMFVIVRFSLVNIAHTKNGPCHYESLSGFFNLRLFVLYVRKS